MTTMSTLLLDPKLINYLLTALYAAKRGTLGRPWKLARRGLLVGGVDHHLGHDLRICAAMTAIAHALADRGNDVYETPEVAVEALLKAESLPAAVWEPACGPGAIVRVLRRHGHVVYATDLVDYNSPDQDASGWDFLLERQLPIGAKAIVTNPPFKLASEFVAHALDLCPKVVMLLRLAFLESERRTSILDGGKLARVHVFRNRLPMMHCAGWQGPRATSSMAFAWLVWDAEHHGPTELHRLSW